jgi:hypothetical protein
MSTRINLFFREFENPNLAEKGVVFPAIRLFGRVQFKTRDDWTDAYVAILDTGAPTWVLPFKVWSECKEFDVITYLAMTNDVPLLIGFQGLLERAALRIDYQGKEAFLEI